MKTLLAFLSGLVVSAVLFYLANGAPAAELLFAFLLGMLTAAIIWRRPRPMRVHRRSDRKTRGARFVPRAEEPAGFAIEEVELEGRGRTCEHPPRPKPRKPETTLTGIPADVASALVNFGMDKKRARATVEAAATPGADFETLLRKALVQK